MIICNYIITTMSDKTQCESCANFQTVIRSKLEGAIHHYRTIQPADITDWEIAYKTHCLLFHKDTAPTVDLIPVTVRSLPDPYQYNVRDSSDDFSAQERLSHERTANSILSSLGAPARQNTPREIYVTPETAEEVSKLKKQNPRVFAAEEK
jgi:hypothetical protein